ncbi:hypothetical protein GCM10023194_40040 [Planotetraspora phitsanulokensis]
MAIIITTASSVDSMAATTPVNSVMRATIEHLFAAFMLRHSDPVDPTSPGAVMCGVRWWLDPGMGDAAHYHPGVRITSTPCSVRFEQHPLEVYRKGVEPDGLAGRVHHLEYEG